MKFIGDFHIHSHFSVATSKELCLPHIDYHARLKGIQLTGTGDFTHPGWFGELREQLEPAEEGLFRVKQEYKIKTVIPCEDYTRFILTTEISCIYKKNGEVRKVHNLIFAPSFDVVEKIRNKLVSYKFNLTSDGRPIIGMDSRNLLEICLECSDEIFFVPAHIWTPWFSVLGSRSGFDSVNECFEDLSRHIHAVEMGLSTDPPMNWACSFLDCYTLTANSDAHSPDKLGRNANIFNTVLSYSSVIDALKTGDPGKFLGTVNFFPQEGKYHYDGHRKCGICWSPYETLRNEGICPVCGKKITIGVMNRIAQLSDRDDILERPNHHPFHSLIPLREILSETESVPSGSPKIDQRYMQILQKAGSEFNILLHFDIEDVKKAGGELLAEAVRRMRNREVIISEGYDGEYGIIKVFNENEIETFKNPVTLFEESGAEYSRKASPLPLLSFDLAAYRRLKEKILSANDLPAAMKNTGDKFLGLNTQQTLAAEHFTGPAMVIAGPGTGKTKVLTSRIAYLIKEKKVSPQDIVAVTFTNKAAGEMRERISALCDKDSLSGLTIDTLHAFGLEIIKSFYKKSGMGDFFLLDETDKEQLLADLGTEKSQVPYIAEKISQIKQSLIPEDEIDYKDVSEILIKYNKTLRESDLFDFDDLLSFPLYLFSEYPEFLYEYRQKIKWMLVDEFQDINLAQYKLIKILMPRPDANIFIIGDPDQAIYGFRGADVRLINRFMNDYPDAVIYKLIKSYRCSDYILRASGNILNAGHGLPEGIQKGLRITIAENATEKSEAEYVARMIEKMIGGTGFFSYDSNVAEGSQYEGIESLSDFAILCRISKLMPALEKALSDHNIPFTKATEEPLFKQEPVKTVIDIFRFILNPSNKPLKSRLIRQGKITDIIAGQLAEETKSMTYKEMIELIISRLPGTNCEDEKARLEFLKDYSKHFRGTQDDFLSNILLASGIDTKERNTEAVNLMTIHSSKGLEFKCVFIIGCEEGLIPFTLFEKFQSNTEEERRLLYVGMTRAERYLFLTSARKRFLMGKELNLKRSHFLDLIEKELVERELQESKKKETKLHEQLKLF